jgi:hypothetical protein
MTASAERLFDVEALGRQMVEAARAVLAGRGRAVRELAEAEIRRLAGVLADIGARAARGEIAPKEAKALVRIHQLTVTSVLRSTEGLSVLATREALRAVTRVAAGTVNGLLEFKLL